MVSFTIQDTVSTRPNVKSEVSSNDIGEFFDIDLDKQARIPKSIHQRMTSVATQPEEREVKVQKNLSEESKEQDVPTWLSERQEAAPIYSSDEYIAIVRKQHIMKMVYFLTEMANNFENKAQYLIPCELLKNEINLFYLRFLELRQDQHFLSIVNLIEIILQSPDLIKSALRDTVSLLKKIADKEMVEYADYEHFTKRYFDLGIDFITLQDTPEEPSKE